MTKEIMVNEKTGEITELYSNVELFDNVVKETNEYKIVKLENGKFEKRMKYNEMATMIAETQEEKIELFRVFNDDENSDLVTPMKDLIGVEFDVEHIFFKQYESFDEDTGDSKAGILTTLKVGEGKYIASSSKSVYYSIKNIYELFGLGFRIKVTGTKRERGIQINVSLVSK